MAQRKKAQVRHGAESILKQVEADMAVARRIEAAAKEVRAVLLKYDVELDLQVREVAYRIVPRRPEG